MLPANPLLNATAPAGPHLPTATLRQYAAGTLAPAARHRVEAHTLACPRCADILDGLLQTPAATTDQALAQLQQRLRRRVQQTESARPVLGRARPSHRWVVPQLAAAATLLFGLVAGGWWTWQQRHAAAPTTVATAPAASAPGTSLPPAVGAASAPVVAVAPSVATTHAAKPVAQQRKRYRKAPLAVRGTVEELAGKPIPAQAPPTINEALTNAVSNSHIASYQTPVALSPAPAPARADSSIQHEQATKAAVSRSAAPAAQVRNSLMPAVPAIPPTPVGGYGAWREKLRHEATEFKPDEGGSLSGSVQLRLLIGVDGKVQQIKVLHGLRADYDEEAQRLVCDGPGWVPGIGSGKRAAQTVDVAVPFQ